MMLALLAWAWLGSMQWGTDIPAFELQYRRPHDAAGWQDSLEDAPADRATVLLFKGGFSFGGTAAVRAALDAAPGVKTVEFDSPGGRIGVADGIAGLIRQRHLATAVTRYCASACTVAYAAGQTRLASQTATFRFHLGAAPILTTFAAQAAVMIEQPWFVRAHVSLAFANRALHAPNEHPYAPQLDELVAAGYVQQLVPALTGDAPGPGLAALQPLLAAVDALEPATGRALVWEHRRRVAGGMPPARSADFVELWAGLVVNRWMARSSDAAAVALADASIAILDATGATEPADCMRWQVGVFDQMEGFRAIPAALRARLRAAQLMVLHDAHGHPNPVPDDRDALQPADQAVRQAITAQFGARALTVAATAEHAFDDPAKSCAVAAAYLRGLRDQPGGGRLLRWALAAG